MDTKPKAKTSETDAYVMLERLQMIVARKAGASARELHGLFASSRNVNCARNWLAFTDNPEELAISCKRESLRDMWRSGNNALSRRAS